MALSPHLRIAALLEAQANKDVTINAMRDALDRGRGTLSLSVAGSGTFLLTTDQARFGMIELTGTLTGSRVIEFPADFDHSVILHNVTTGAFVVDARYGTGAAARIPRGCAVPIRRSGTAAVYDARGMAVLPEWSAHRETTAQALTPATDTIVQFNAETSDTAEAFDSTTAWRFTAPTAGLYEVTARAEIEVTVAGTGDTNATIAIRRAAVVWMRGDLIQGPTASIGIQRVGVNAVIPVTAGMHLDVIVRQDQVGSTSRINFGRDRTHFFGRAIRLG